MGTSPCTTSATWTAGGGGGGGGGLWQATLASSQRSEMIRVLIEMIRVFMTIDAFMFRAEPEWLRRLCPRSRGVTRCRRVAQLCGGTTATASRTTREAQARVCSPHAFESTGCGVASCPEQCWLAFRRGPHRLVVGLDLAVETVADDDLGQAARRLARLRRGARRARAERQRCSIRGARHPAWRRRLRDREKHVRHGSRR